MGPDLLYHARRSRFAFLRAALLAPVILSLSAAYALADSYESNNSVLAPKSEFALLPASTDSSADLPPGTRPFGPFLLFTALNLSEKYDDNILAQESGAKSDFITEIQPNVGLQKNFGPHSIAVDASATFQHFVKYQDENTTDYRVRSSGNFEAYRSLNIPFSVSFTHDHKDRFNRRLSSVTKNPMEFETTDAMTGFILKPNRLELRVIGTYTQQRYENGTFLLSGLPSIHEDADNNELQFKTTLSYEGGAGWAPYLEGTYTEQEYLKNAYTNGSFSGPKRDNHLIRMHAGTRYSYHDVFSGFFGLGWEKRNYKDPSLKAVSAFSGEMGLMFRPTERLDIQADLARTTKEDNILQAGSKNLSSNLTASYELDQDLFLHLQGGLLQRDFQDSSRKDNEYGESLLLEYLLAPRLKLGAGVELKQTNSNVTGFSYDDAQFIIRATSSL